MNKQLKIILLGLLIWAIPFVVSFFVWDVGANAPSIPTGWFNAIMAFSWAIGFAIAACIYFKKASKQRSEGWIVGLSWYVILLVMDLIVLVLLMGMSMTDYFPMILTYFNTFLITGVIGNILAKN